jgi:hypothetical protein
MIDTYLIANNIKKDDGVTNASTHTCFEDDKKAITRLLLVKNLDVIAVISRGQTYTLYDSKRDPYAFNEKIKIEAFAINKSTITASNVLEKYEQEIRRIFTVYDAYQTVKDINTITPNASDLGSALLYHTTITINYKRINDDYTNSGVTVTWGPSATPTGTYTIPNITYVSPPIKTYISRLNSYGRMGNITQKGGIPDYAIKIRCDPTIESSALTWKRPQTSSPKTDILPWQVFFDIAFNGQLSETYQTLNLGWGGTLKVTLEEVTPQETDEGTVLELLFFVYNSASATTYKGFFGINP